MSLSRKKRSSARPGPTRSKTSPIRQEGRTRRKQAPLTFEAALAKYESGAHNTAFQALRRLAEDGDVRAMQWLGHLYRRGHGCRTNVVEAAKWYLQAWKNQDESAFDSLVEILPKLKARALRGSATAQFALGVVELQSENNLESGVAWLKMAGEQDHPEALQQLGKCYRDGTGVPVDPALSFRFTKRAADLGDGKAQFFVGWYFSQGLGPQGPDLEQGLVWYRKSADQGFWPANMALCKLLAARNRDLGDAREVVQRLRALAAANPRHKKYSISSDDGEWAVVVSDRGATVGLSGLELVELGIDLT